MEGLYSCILYQLASGRTELILSLSVCDLHETQMITNTHVSAKATIKSKSYVFAILSSLLICHQIRNQSEKDFLQIEVNEGNALKNAKIYTIIYGKFPQEVKARPQLPTKDTCGN